jgi:hypothetical protein
VSCSERGTCECSADSRIEQHHFISRGGDSHMAAKKKAAKKKGTKKKAAKKKK